MMKRWLAAFAVVVAAIVVPVSAWAKERPSHRLVAEGDLPRARTAVVTALGEDLSAVEHAAHLELLVVIDRWSAAGVRPRAHVASEAIEAPIAEGDDWAASYNAARDSLVAGRYMAAELDFMVLARSAPDLPSRARAQELASLAHEIRMHDLAPPASPTPRAEAPPAPTTGPAKAEEWYGWETLICDGVSILTAPFIVGIGGYVLCAPIVHLGNGQPLMALASVGLRLGAPLGLALAGRAIEVGASSGSCEGYCVRGAFVGFGVGIITAIVVDSVVLARKEVRPKEKASAILPTGSAQAGRVEIGIAGTF